MKRLTIFAKGNLDIRDTLHSLWIGGELRWNGINQLIREEGGELAIRVRHETFSRSDALLAAGGAIPAELAGRELALKSHALAAQFSDKLFSTPADAYVLTVQPDIQIELAIHGSSGFAFYPDNLDAWPPEQREWLRSEFTRGPLIDVEDSMANFAEIVRRIRTVSDAPILVYNVSSAVPGETLHCHEGLDESLSTRIRHFNLALVDLSRQTGVSIIDVDRIVAQAGAETLKLDVTHLSAAGCRAVAGEVLRVLRDYGVMDEPGQQGSAADG
ncbi:MAG: SGNH/GDSL hydrolase family protein [Novosphingobium sp.]